MAAPSLRVRVAPALAAVESMWPPMSRQALSTSSLASSLSANGHSKPPSHFLSAGSPAKRKDLPGPVEMTAPR
eukprot:6185371-Alexandrium_andersonii.AAC.1